MMANSWDNIESDMLACYQGERDALDEDSSTFLRSLNFVENGSTFSEIGRRYLDSKFIVEDGEHQNILRNELLNIEEMRSLCQTFYGQQTQRKNVERFFKSKTEVDDETEVGRILALLNKVDIVSYNKRKGSVQFLETDQVEEQDIDSYRVTHRTPYSNLVRFRKAIRACAGDLLWVDAHFSKKGLEPLAEEVTGDQFDTVRVLCGPAHVSTDMRDDFKRFRQEMVNRGISSEIRVITSEDRLRTLHDRWLISNKGTSWNVPPINSIYGNQESEIHKTSENLDFEEWWNEAEDIIEDWNNIQGHIN